MTVFVSKVDFRLFKPRLLKMANSMRLYIGPPPGIEPACSRNPAECSDHGANRFLDNFHYYFYTRVHYQVI
jgi:hypothetical protein